MCWNDKRSTLSQWNEMVGGEWVAWVVIPLAAQFAEGNLFALLD
jgi:hypothetical protein